MSHYLPQRKLFKHFFFWAIPSDTLFFYTWPIDANCKKIISFIVEQIPTLGVDYFFCYVWKTERKAPKTPAKTKPPPSTPSRTPSTNYSKALAPFFYREKKLSEPELWVLYIDWCWKGLKKLPISTINVNNSANSPKKVNLLNFFWDMLIRNLQSTSKNKWIGNTERVRKYILFMNLMFFYWFFCCGMIEKLKTKSHYVNVISNPIPSLEHLKKVI